MQLGVVVPFASVVIGKYLYTDESAIEEQQGASVSQRRLRPRGGAFGHCSLGAASLRGKIAPVRVLVVTDHHTR